MSDQGNIQAPWEAAGISKRTWYRRRAKERGKPNAPNPYRRSHYDLNRYLANRVNIRAWHLNYNFKKPEKMLFYCAKSRAKKKGLEFNIELTDVVIPEMCPVLGIPIFRSKPVAKEIKRNMPNSPSLDRIIPSLGYVKGNVRVISWRANDLKSDGRLEEFEAIVSYLQRMMRK